MLAHALIGAQAACSERRRVGARPPRESQVRPLICDRQRRALNHLLPDLFLHDRPVRPSAAKRRTRAAASSRVFVGSRRAAIHSQARLGLRRRGRRACNRRHSSRMGGCWRSIWVTSSARSTSPTPGNARILSPCPRARGSRRRARRGLQTVCSRCPEMRRNCSSMDRFPTVLKRIHAGLGLVVAVVTNVAAVGVEFVVPRGPVDRLDEAWKRSGLPAAENRRWLSSFTTEPIPRSS